MAFATSCTGTFDALHPPSHDLSLTSAAPTSDASTPVRSPPMPDWYILDDKGLDGPYALSELESMLHTGELGTSEKVQEGCEGTPLMVREVEELKAVASQGSRRRRASRARGATDNTWIIILAIFAGIACLGCVIVVPALLLPAVQQARQAARKAQTGNHLQQIALGMHRYHDTHKMFPPGGVFAENGREHHGWPTYLLPFVDEPALYDALDVGRTGWQDPAIGPLLGKEVGYYLNATVSESITPDGLAAIHYSGNNRILFVNSSIRLRDIIDGSSQTMMIGEISAAYPPWASPHNYRDLSLGFGRSERQFGRPTGPGCQVGMADAQVKLISEEIESDVLEAIATHNGREPVSLR